MKAQTKDESLMQKLNEYESIESIQPSAEWNNSLMNRLNSAKPNKNKRYSPLGIAVIITFIVVINLGFLIKSLMDNAEDSQQRNMDLQVISKELLINSNNN
ncbi:MAG: hypothetical protein NTY74_03335 [Ignavibacteriae bacterium]|nr:hypothetical protein [Ignavibacteriota bacterium]